MRPFLRLITVFFLSLIVIQTAEARRLKVYSIPKKISPGQLGVIVFENPMPDQVKAISKCTADKLTGFVKSDIPMLRIEQNGKQVWTSLGSYRTQGDSCIATFMTPLSLLPGAASMFLMNDRDASVPASFTVVSEVESVLTGIEGLGLTPLAQFRVFGVGFLPAYPLDPTNAKVELEANIGLSKLPKAEAWTALNHRIASDWARQPEGDFLFIEQAGKTWEIFVEQCSLSGTHLALDFTAPPDLKPGPAKLTLSLRLNSKVVEKTPPITVQVL